MDQPLKANFFPGILEGVAGRLGLVPPGVANPPTSSTAGASRQWAAALRQAVIRMEGRDINFEQVMHNVVPPGLHLDYDPDFQTRGVDDIAPTLTSPLLSGLIDNICHLEKPEIPGRPTSFEADEGLWGHGWAPPNPDVMGPSHDDGMAAKMPASEGEVLENEPCDQGESHQDQPLSEPDSEEVAEIVISKGDECDLTIKEPQAVSMPKSEPAQCWKRSPEDQGPHPSPAKKWATREEEKSMPQQEAALPKGVKMEDILPKRYETLAADNDWVHQVRCSLLGLEAGTTPSKEDINTSEQFIPRAAAWESEPPEVITDHWLPSSRKKASLLSVLPTSLLQRLTGSPCTPRTA